MKNKILIILTTLVLSSCSNPNKIELVCISDDINPFKSGKEKLTITIDDKKITTSNNFVYENCGDSLNYILGGQEIRNDRCEKFEDDTYAPFMFNKTNGELFFNWWKDDDASSPIYTFTGKCVAEKNNLTKRNVTIKTAKENNDIAVFIVKELPKSSNEKK